MTGPAKSQLPQIRGVLKLYKASSIITGTFLILLMITWGIRRLPFLGYDLWLLGPNGFITFEQYGVDGLGLPEVGFNLTVEGAEYLRHVRDGLGCFQRLANMKATLVREDFSEPPGH